MRIRPSKAGRISSPRTRAQSAAVPKPSISILAWDQLPDSDLDLPSTSPKPPQNPKPSSSSTSRPKPSFSTSPLGIYNCASPPTRHQIQQANTYFNRSSPRHLLSTHNPKLLLPSSTPHVVLIGRSNAGKSRLLNALLNAARNPLASVSKKPGHTKCLHLYGVGSVAAGSKTLVKPGLNINLLHANARKKATKEELWIHGPGLVVVDSPGYGMGSRHEWGSMMQQLYQHATQVRCAFLLIDISSWTNGTEASRAEQQLDLAAVDMLRHHHVPYHFVVTKVDKVLGTASNLDLDPSHHRMDRLKRLCQQIEQHFKTSSEVNSATPVPPSNPSILHHLPQPNILCVSADTVVGRAERLGIGALRSAILSAADTTV